MISICILSCQLLKFHFAPKNFLNWRGKIGGEKRFDQFTVVADKNEGKYGLWPAEICQGKN
jgi:hypothetical protein